MVPTGSRAQLSGRGVAVTPQGQHVAQLLRRGQRRGATAGANGLGQRTGVVAWGGLFNQERAGQKRATQGGGRDAVWVGLGVRS